MIELAKLGRLVSYAYMQGGGVAETVEELERRKGAWFLEKLELQGFCLVAQGDGRPATTSP